MAMWRIRGSQDFGPQCLVGREFGVCGGEVHMACILDGGHHGLWRWWLFGVLRIGSWLSQDDGCLDRQNPFLEVENLDIAQSHEDINREADMVFRRWTSM